MKKFFASLITVALLATMPITAFAGEAELNNDNKSAYVDVTAKYASGITDAGTIYNVDVTWESMEFIYTATGVKTWNPENHQYEVVNSDGAWNHTTSEITVTNHSNAIVTTSFTFDPVTDSTVTGSFNNATVELPSAEGMASDAAELTGKTTFTVDGTMPESQTEFVKVGTITVTIE
jgi:hypothetical protein